MDPADNSAFATPITLRIVLPIFLTVILFITAIFIIILPALEESLMARKKETIKELTQSAWTILQTHEELHQSGELSLEQAKSEVIHHIERLRYGPEHKDYFWINDMQPKMIMHPYRRDLNGKDVGHFQDPEGRFLFLDFVEVVKRQGEGYVEYMWQWKDDPTRIETKISYVRSFEPWGWIIGSGLYIDDVEQEIVAIRDKLGLISACILTVVIVAAGYIIRQTVIADRMRQRIWNERSALLEALEISEEQYRSMVEHSSDWIWEMDTDGVYTYASSKVKDLLGMAPHEVVGKAMIDLMIAGEKPLAGAVFKQVLAEAEPFVGLESICRHKDSRSIVLESNGVPVFNEKKELIGYRGITRDISERKQSEVALWKSHNQLRRNLEETVRSLALAAEKRDPYTAGHQIRVERLAHAIGKELGLSPNRLDGLHFASLLHDIGKISLPSEYLAKPTKLNAEERTIIKCHTEAGYEILKNIHFPWPVADIVLQHHELLDGSGYPNGLKDDDIMLESKIITVADVVEAMSSHRPYRPALGLEAALNEIRSGRGSKYDKQIVDTCLYLITEARYNLEFEQQTGSV